MLKRSAKEPLLHFLLLAATLFFADAFVNPAATTDPLTITVDQASLLFYLQNRSRVFDRAHSIQTLENMSADELQRLIDDFVKEEALYREAKAMKLDQTDYVSRLRLIQKLKYITEGFAADSVVLSDEEVRAYYEAHRDQYFEPATITFTHVFLNSERHPTAKSLAEAMVDELNVNHTSFHEAPAHGDRFPFQVNYVEEPFDLVASHLGVRMANDLFALEPDEERWRGPYPSAYGWHVVLVAGKNDGRVPSLDEIHDRVLQDLRVARRKVQVDEALDAIISSYKVSIDKSVRPRPLHQP